MTGKISRCDERGDREDKKMQIRLAVGEQDSRYLEHFVTYLERNYMDRLEVSSFTRLETFREMVTRGSFDVILVDEEFGISAEELREYGRTAFLSETENRDSGDGIRRIAKYKKPDLIYKDILDIYAESGAHGVFQKSHQGQITLVTGFSGGTGASTFAAALAKHYAAAGKKVLYLNLEPMGMSSDFFQGMGDYHFEDVIFALKSRRADVGLKMESTVRTDASGVNFFAPCTNAMYMLELGDEEQKKLLDAAEGLGYEQIIVDKQMTLDSDGLDFLGRMDQVLVVQDGGETSNSKTLRTIEALKILEQQKKEHYLDRMKLLYNRFSSSKSSSEIPGLPIPVIGKFPPIKHALVGEIIDYMMTKQDIFQRL